jgi:hypothetical protein
MDDPRLGRAEGVDGSGANDLRLEGKPQRHEDTKNGLRH